MLRESFVNYLMTEALSQAALARELGEVPIGAVIAYNGEIVARAHNLMEASKDPTSHAECLAIREASRVLNNWRLTKAILCCTLEPCTMCVGAIKLARIPTVIYGARDERAGALGSIYDLSLDGNPSRVVSGIYERECGEILTNFFKLRRDGRVVEGA